jgi:quinol monooxygenase YgiN
MRRRTFMAASAAAIAAQTMSESRAQQPADTGKSEVNVIVTQRVLPGKEAEFEALARELEASTVANDKGCLRYEWYRAETPGTYILIERWVDRDAVQAHRKSPHMAAATEKAKPLAPEPFSVTRLSKL